MTTPIFDENNLAGTDYAGGTGCLPAIPAAPGAVVLGSDFASGALPLTVTVEPRQPAEEWAA